MEALLVLEEALWGSWSTCRWISSLIFVKDSTSEFSSNIWTWNGPFLRHYSGVQQINLFLCPPEMLVAIVPINVDINKKNYGTYMRVEN